MRTRTSSPWGSSISPRGFSLDPFDQRRNVALNAVSSAAMIDSSSETGRASSRARASTPRRLPGRRGRRLPRGPPGPSRRPPARTGPARRPPVTGRRAWCSRPGSSPLLPWAGTIEQSTCDMQGNRRERPFSPAAARVPESVDAARGGKRGSEMLAPPRSNSSCGTGCTWPTSRRGATRRRSSSSAGRWPCRCSGISRRPRRACADGQLRPTGDLRPAGYGLLGPDGPLGAAGAR